MAYLGQTALPFDPLRSAAPTSDADRFSGNGSTSTFTLSRPVTFPTDIEVFVENIQQEPINSYSVVGTSLVFTEAPPTGTNNVYVVYRNYQSGAQITLPDGSVTYNKLANNIRLFTTDNYTSNAGTTTYTMSEQPADANTVLVTIDGIVQRATEHYTVSGRTLTFTSTPSANSLISIRHLGFRTTTTVTAISPGANLSNPIVVNGMSITGNTTLSSGSLVLSPGTAGQPALSFAGNTSTGIFFPATSTIAFSEGGTEAMRIDASGNVGIGTSSPADRLDVRFATGSGNFRVGVSGSNNVKVYNTAGDFYVASSDGASDVALDSQRNVLFITANTERARITSSGNLLFGTTTTAGGEVARFQSTVNTAIGIISPTNGQSFVNFGDTSDPNVGFIGYNHSSDFMHFRTAGNERARITNDGVFMIGSTDLPNRDTTQGVYLGGGVVQGVRTSNATGDFGRLSTSGDIVVFRLSGVTQGSISGSGSTISYNAFAGSHWSQLQDGSKPEILRGTVMESINELCEWPDEPNTERLCRVKISDTEGSKKVYGVFMDWDNDWTSTNDMLVTALGAFVCRVNGSVTVEEGDLLESNGDGTARVQADDIIRSSTIGKVTSTTKTHEYDDDSYCVPTVLYCG